MGYSLLLGRSFVQALLRVYFGFPAGRTSTTRKANTQPRLATVSHCESSFKKLGAIQVGDVASDQNYSSPSRVLLSVLLI